MHKESEECYKYFLSLINVNLNYLLKVFRGESGDKRGIGVLHQDVSVIISRICSIEGLSFTTHFLHSNGSFWTSVMVL